MNRKYRSQLLALPAKERMDIAIELFDSLAGETDDLEITPQWIAEIALRIDDIKKHPGDSLPWREAMARIESQLHDMKKV